MNLTISGKASGILVHRHGIHAHLPCHAAVVHVKNKHQPDLDIHAVFSPAPHPCWLIGAKGKTAPDQGESSLFSVAVDDDASIEIETEDGDRTELF